MVHAIFLDPERPEVFAGFILIEHAGVLYVVYIFFLTLTNQPGTLENNCFFHIKYLVSCVFTLGSNRRQVLMCYRELVEHTKKVRFSAIFQLFLRSTLINLLRLQMT
jgi:hypothetical protein